MIKKTVIITGGGSGIGLSITEAFVDAGYFVIVGARKKIDLSSKFGKNALFVKADVRKESSHKLLAKIAKKMTGRLDVYINNAGVSEWKPISKINKRIIDRIISTNLIGTLWGCKVASNFLKNGGNIINISSIAGKRGTSNNSLYCASKFGVNGITQSLSKELGSRGIRVNSVCPVLIPTAGLLKALRSSHSPSKINPLKFIKQFARQNASLKRLPLSKEVASTCVFLASDHASAITGQNINVDCGVLPQ